MDDEDEGLESVGVAEGGGRRRKKADDDEPFEGKRSKFISSFIAGL